MFTFDNFLILAILVITLGLFITEKLRVDLVAFLALGAVVITGLVTPEEAIRGFSNAAVITVGAVFVISESLRRSGVADRIASLITRLTGPNTTDPTRLIIVIMSITAVMSAFMNNIGAVAILLPAVMAIARERGISPSKLLMPLSWAALMGGNLTLIGTPPNIIANEILRNYSSVDAFGFFDFTPMGLIAIGVGTLYMAFIGQRLMPDRNPGQELVDTYTVREYLCQVRIEPNSQLIGKSVRNLRLATDYNLTVLHIIDNEGETRTVMSNHLLEAADMLVVQAPPDQLRAACQVLNLTPIETGSTTGLQELAEITPLHRSRILGSNLRQLNFRDRYGVSVLALRQKGRDLYSQMAESPLTLGDVLLVEGPPERINQLRRDADFLVLDVQPRETVRPEKGPIAIGILVLALIAISVFSTNTSITLMFAALTMVFARIINIDDAYKAIDWKIIFLLIGMLPLGDAMENTGTTTLLSNFVIDTVGQFGPLVVLIGLYILATILTEVLSNAAAAVLIIPIAIEIALGMGVNPRTFVMASVMAISLDFLTPIGHQVNVLIYSPGGYRFSDFFRVGIGLTILLTIAAVLLLPLIWPL